MFLYKLKNENSYGSRSINYGIIFIHVKKSMYICIWTIFDKYNEYFRKYTTNSVEKFNKIRQLLYYKFTGLSSEWIIIDISTAKEARLTFKGAFLTTINYIYGVVINSNLYEPIIHFQNQPHYCIIPFHPFYIFLYYAIA